MSYTPRLGASKGDHDLLGYRSFVFLWASENPSNAEQKVMNCFLTGGSGFIGANLVHDLLARGHRVKALLRPRSDLRGLAGADFERVECVLSDVPWLRAAMRGWECCFSVAAGSRIW